MPLARRPDTDVLDTLNRLRATVRGYTLEQVYDTSPNPNMPYIIKAPKHVSPKALFSLDLINFISDYETHIIDAQINNHASASTDLKAELAIEKLKNSEIWRIIRAFETCAVQSEPYLISHMSQWARDNGYSHMPPTMAEIMLQREISSYQEINRLKAEIAQLKGEK